MGKSARKMKLKGQKSISKTPVSSIGTELSQNKSGKIIRNSFKEEYNEGTVLVELPACRRMLFVGKNPYFVSLPKIRLFIPYVKKRTGEYASRFVRMCFVHNKKKTILVPPLPNIFQDLKVCCPGASGKTLEDLIAEQAKVLFASQFNDETWDTLDEYYHNEFFEDDYDDEYEVGSIKRYMEKWMKKTKKNPDWIPKKFAEYSGEKSDFTNPDDEDDY